MKLVQLTAVYGVAAMALLLSVTSCKKSSSSTPKVGTFTFTMNGQAESLTAIGDTTIGGVGSITLVAEGVEASTHDSIELNLAIEGWNATSYTQLTGIFADSATYEGKTCNLNYNDLKTGYIWEDNPNQTNVLTANITSNNGSVATGTFSGTLWLMLGSSPDSLVITNGKFNVQL